MARIRTIKPEFCTSEQVVECSTTARLLFVCMWCFCDDGGNHVASVKRIKMEIFPADQFSHSEISEMIEELITTRLIVEYEYENQTYWHVTGWEKHQKIEKPTYRYPKFDESLIKIRRTVVEQSSNDHREVVEPSTPEGKGMELVMEKKGIKPTNQPQHAYTHTQEKLISVFTEKRSSLEQKFPNIDLDFAFEKMLQLKRDGPIGTDVYVAIMNFMHTEYPRPKGNGNGKHDGKPTKKAGIIPPNGPDADWLGGTPFASDA